MESRGFTLIELLVVVAIIGILASVILSSLNSAREKGRDTKRIADLKQIATALEMYFNDYGRYPARNNARTGTEACGGNSAWCSLVNDLNLYISSIPGDPLGSQINYRYYYDSDPGDNNQTYGMMVRLEASGNFDKVTDDGGYYNSSSSGGYYEVGQQPRYCMSEAGYTSSNRNWWGSPTTVCTGGN